MVKTSNFPNTDTLSTKSSVDWGIPITESILTNIYILLCYFRTTTDVYRENKATNRVYANGKQITTCLVLLADIKGLFFCFAFFTTSIQIGFSLRVHDVFAMICYTHIAFKGLPSGAGLLYGPLSFLRRQQLQLHLYDNVSIRHVAIA